MASEHLSIEWITKFHEWDHSTVCGSRAAFRSYPCYLMSTKWYLYYISDYHGPEKCGRSYNSSRVTLQLRRESHGKKVKVDGIYYISSEKRTFKHYLDHIMHNDDKDISIIEYNRKDLPNNNITICCEAWIRELTAEEKSVQTLPTFFKLSRDMHVMHQKQDHSDLIVICRDMEIRAHKCILSARSPVFAKMFQHATTENCDSRIVITDLDPDVLEELLQFLYCGKINPSAYSKAHDLYYAAEKYFVSDLKDLCRDFITSSLSITSAVETLILADRHKDEEMLQKAITFIASSFQCINSTEPWTILQQENPPLAAQVLSLVEIKSRSGNNDDV